MDIEVAAALADVELYDFGIGQILFPQPDFKSGSYLTTSLCFPFVRGFSERPLRGAHNNMPHAGELHDWGDGWKITCVEVPYMCFTEELSAKLIDAKKLLLGEVKNG